jgi:hypothetical protein
MEVKRVINVARNCNFQLAIPPTFQKYLSLHGAQNQKHQFDVIVLEGVELACFNYWDISRSRPNQWWLNLAHHTYRERS